MGGSGRATEADPGQLRIPPVVGQVLASGGTPLDAATRRVMEPRLRHDLGDVRIHASPDAAQAARSLRARAFTAGSHIVLGSPAPPFASPAGTRLLAHELTHVVQNAGLAPREAAQVAAPGSTIEREASQVAAAVGDGGLAPPISRASSPAIGLFRDDALGQQEEAQPAPVSVDVTALANAGFQYVLDKARSARAASASLLLKRVAGLPPALQPAGRRVAGAIDVDLGAVLDLLFFDLGVVVGFAEGLASMVTGAVTLVVTIVRIVGDIGLAMIGAAESALADAGLIDNADDSLLQPYGDDLWNAYLLWHEVQYFDVAGFLQTWWENFQKLSPEEQAYKAGTFVGELAAFLATWAEAGARLGTVLPPPPGPAPQVAAELAGGGAISVPAAGEGATVAERLGGPLGGLGGATVTQMAGSRTTSRQPPPRQPEEAEGITRPVRRPLTDEDRAEAAALRDRTRSTLDEKWPPEKGGAPLPSDFEDAREALDTAKATATDDVRAAAAELLGDDDHPGLLRLAVEALRDPGNYAQVLSDLDLMRLAISEDKTLEGYTQAAVEMARDRGDVYQVYIGTVDDQSAVLMRPHGSDITGERLGGHSDPGTGYVDSKVFMDRLSGRMFVDNAIENDMAAQEKLHGPLMHLIHYFVLDNRFHGTGMTVGQFFAKVNLVSRELELGDKLWVGLMDPLNPGPATMAHPETLWPMVWRLLGIPSPPGKP